MAKVFYVSDTHFGHSNIITFVKESRPFKTIEEHDAFLVEKWNEKVGKDDLVYHLGDVSFSDDLSVLNKLNGRKILILGNHETKNIKEYLPYFEDCKSCLVQEDLLFSHYPVHPDQLEFAYRINIHGHLHIFQVDDPRYINISIENTGLAPIEHNDLMEIVAERRQIWEKQKEFENDNMPKHKNNTKVSFNRKNKPKI